MHNPTQSHAPKEPLPDMHKQNTKDSAARKASGSSPANAQSANKNPASTRKKVLFDQDKGQERRPRTVARQTQKPAPRVRQAQKDEPRRQALSPRAEGRTEEKNPLHRRRETELREEEKQLDRQRRIDEKRAAQKRREEEERQHAWEAREKEKARKRKAKLAREDARMEQKAHRLSAAAKKRELDEAKRKDREARRAKRASDKQARAAYREKHPGFYNPNLRIHTVLAVSLVVLAVFFTVSLLLRTQTGSAGTVIAELLLGSFSYTAYLLPLFMLIHALLWKKDIRNRVLGKKALCFLPVLLMASVLAAVLSPEFDPAAFSFSDAYLAGQNYRGGGSIGGAVGYFLWRSIGLVGILILCFLLFLAFALLYFRDPCLALLARARTFAREAQIHRAQEKARKKEKREEAQPETVTEPRAMPEANPRRLLRSRTRQEENAEPDVASVAGENPSVSDAGTVAPSGNGTGKKDRKSLGLERRRALFRDLETNTLTVERQNMETGNRDRKIFDYEIGDGASAEAAEDDNLFTPSSTRAAEKSTTVSDLMCWDGDDEDFANDRLTVTTEKISAVSVSVPKKPDAAPGRVPVSSAMQKKAGAVSAKVADMRASAQQKAGNAPAQNADATGQEEKGGSGMDYFRSITVNANPQPDPTPSVPDLSRLSPAAHSLSSAQIAAQPDRSGPSDPPIGAPRATDIPTMSSRPADPAVPTVTKPGSEGSPVPAPAGAQGIRTDADATDSDNHKPDTVQAEGQAPKTGDLPFTAASSLRTDLQAARSVIPPSADTAAAPAPAARPSGGAFRPLTEPDERSDATPPPPKPKRPYQYPPVSLLALPEVPNEGNIAAEVQANAEKLVQTLDNFKVRTHVAGYSRGPRITRYEVVPDAGVRVRAISSLVEDISMNLATSGIRIEAPIPGKSAVGVEVPNTAPTIVRLRRLLDTDKFRNFPEKTVVCLGEDVTGQPVYCDLAKMPHMLVAGATGMGKSVCINSIITSLLYKASPDEVKLIMIDPKKVEFGIYSGIPHLLVPVVTDPKKAAGALSWAVTEMERRFDLIERAGVRDIKGYNRSLAEAGGGDPLPKIIIIIDELHDLMMSAADAVETSIARIAAKARAAGIHLLIGTQRPSVDVITGTIKANIPSRIAFHVSSQVDSRTILDFAGAEKLLAHGDMLFAPVGMSKPQRVQGAFVDDKEIDRIVEFIKENNDADTERGEQIMADIEREAEKCAPQKKNGEDASPSGGSNIPSDEDDHHLQWAALEVGFEFGRMSTSLLQRKLSVGYGKAAKILDALEEAGYISAQEGAKPREILISREEFKEMMARGVAEQTHGNF